MLSSRCPTFVRALHVPEGYWRAGIASIAGSGCWAVASAHHSAHAAAAGYGSVTVPRLDANASWHVREVSASGVVYDGIWTRTGAHSFRAEWRAAGSGDVIRDMVEIERQFARRNGRYIGTISRDGRFIQGHASWYGPGGR
jgi:hypothetical protein